MMRVGLWLLVVYLILVGTLAVTNIRVEWGPTIWGFSALAAGICIAIALVQGSKGPSP